MSDENENVKVDEKIDENPVVDGKVDESVTEIIEESVVEEQPQVINVNIPKDEEKEEKISLSAFERLKKTFAPPKQSKVVPDDIKVQLANQEKLIAEQAAKTEELAEIILKQQDIINNNKVPVSNTPDPVKSVDDPVVQQFNQNNVNTPKGVPDQNNPVFPPAPEYADQIQNPLNSQTEVNRFGQSVPVNTTVPDGVGLKSPQNPYDIQNERSPSPVAPVVERVDESPEIPSNFAVMDQLGRDRLTGEKIINKKTTATVNYGNNW